MNGSGLVAAAAGLALAIGAGAAGGAWLIERALSDAADAALEREGIGATVSFSGRDATVSAAPEHLDQALGVVARVAGVANVFASRTAPAAPSVTPAPVMSQAPSGGVSASPSLSPKPAPSPSLAPAPTASATPSSSPAPAPVPMPKVVIQFEGGSAEMVAGQEAKLEAMAAWLRAHPGVEVEVAGHTDNGRTASFRAELGRLRAQRVVDALVAAGISGERLLVVAKAEKDPAASNDSAEGRAENRRVTFASRGER